MSANFEIVTIAPRVRSVAGASFVHVQEITFVSLPNRLPGTVDVPDDQFDPAGVTAIVTPLAANLEAVKAL